MKKQSKMLTKDSMKSIESEKEENHSMDIKLKAAIELMKISLRNSMAYAEAIDTPEKRAEIARKIREAQDQARYKEDLAYARASDEPLL